MTLNAFAGTAQTGQSTSRIPATPANFWEFAGPQDVQPIPFEVIDPDQNAVQVRFHDPVLQYDQVTLEGQMFTSVKMHGEGTTIEQGEPDLPRSTKLIMISPTGNVRAVVTSSSYTVVPNIDVAPKQPYEGEPLANRLDGMNFAYDSDIYSQDAWYPQDIAVISSPATLRDVRFVSLAVAPVQYNPARRELRVYDNLEVEVENIGGIGENEIVITPVFVSPSFKKLYYRFENFAGSALDELPVLPGKYLIICPNNTNNTSQAQRLVDWHRRKGLDASYVTLAQTGATEPLIRSYISTLYYSTNGALEYVCFFGDPGASSTFSTPTNSTTFDNEYGVVTPAGGPNPDPVPDIAVGRLPSESDLTLEALVNKTINYESAPYFGDPTWTKRSFCAAHTAQINSNPSTKEYTRQIMLQDGMSCPSVGVFPGSINSTQINGILDDLITVFNHRMSWISEMTNSALASAPAVGGTDSTGGALPLVYSMTCGTGNFQTTGQGLSEEWLIPPTQTPASPRGAIGCVGLQGSGTHVPYNNIVDAGAMYGIFALDIHEMGVINIAGKLELYRNYATFDNTPVNNFCHWANLMGDPATAIWTKSLYPTTVVHANTINRGTNNVTVTVTNPGLQNVEGALVCLLKGTETFARGYTNANGQVNLPVATPTTGTMLVTVTKEDQRPYLGNITVTNVPANLTYNSVSIDDDNISGTIGNNDDVLNPGETIDLNINVTNTGTSTTVASISGTLTSPSAGITIVNGSRSYPNIAPGGNANPTSPFRISVSSVFNNEPIQLFLDLSTDQGPYTVRLDLTPAAPDVAYTSFSFGGPGGNLNPNESGTFTPTITNSGARPLIGADGILRSLDPRVSVTDSVGIFGNISAGATGSTASNTFSIAISSAMFNGHETTMQLVVYDDSGFRDSVNFDLTIGIFTSTSPSGPDAYGYYVFDNTETQPANAPSSYEWLEIAPAIGGSGTNLNMSDTAEDDDDTQVLTLPFNFMFYGNTFSQITVCSNGWIAFGSYPTMIDFRNYRMGSPIGPPNMIAAYWDDLRVSGATENVYTYYDTAENYYVIEWRARTLWTSAVEIFEIILYDPVHYPSATGDGKFKVQYNTVNLSANNATNDNPYASVGIQNEDHAIGLDYYYWNSYGPGAAPLTAGRSTMYTTDETGQLNPSVEVATPNGGETYYLGQPLNVLWSSSAISGTVDIELNRNYPGGAWEDLFTGTTNDGVQSWIPTGSATNNARIRVMSVDFPAVGDTSDADFTLIVPTVSLSTPNGGELYAPGGHVEIVWSATGLGPAKVELNRDYPGGTWEVLSAAAPGGLAWTATGPTTNHARIRVSGVGYPAAFDESDADFTIGVAPVVTHKQKADQASGAATFVALLQDDTPGSDVMRAYYRVVGGGSFDSVAFSATGNQNEYAATLPGLVDGNYEYYVQVVDAETLTDRVPNSGTYKFQVGDICTPWISHDDGTAENYNWVDGPDFEWAVYYDVTNYPFNLCSIQYAVNPTAPTEMKASVIVSVYLADGQGGSPGTLVVRDTTGTTNVVGGLPGGAAWTNVVFGSVPVTGPFYVSVKNIEPRDCPVAFALDTDSPTGNSYFYDACDDTWYAESAATDNARNGNRMIRVSGFNFDAPTITIISSGSDVVLNWTSTGAPFYRIFSSTNVNGPYDTLVGSTSNTTFTHVGVANTLLQNFYIVVSSATP